MTKRYKGSRKGNRLFETVHQEIKITETEVAVCVCVCVCVCTVCKTQHFVVQELMLKHISAYILPPAPTLLSYT